MQNDDEISSLHLFRKGTFCENPEQKFFFDVKTLACGQFEYTGCGPEEANRFDDEETCLATCGVAQSIPNIESLIVPEYGTKTFS